MAGWQSGHAAACKAVYAGSIPTSASIAIQIFKRLRALFYAHHPDSDAKPDALSSLTVRTKHLEQRLHQRANTGVANGVIDRLTLATSFYHAIAPHKR